MKQRLIVILLMLLASVAVRADIFLPRLLSEGAVLQHGQDNSLWGWANNGEVVSVFLNGNKVGETTADAGTWSLTLSPQEAGGPHTLRFQGNNTVTLKDIYFGDVWLASGQSNMEYPLSRVKTRFPEEISNANNPEIRFFRAPKRYEFSRPKKDFAGGNWSAVTPQTAADMSAVAWFFSKNIHAEHNIPIGIIDNSYGGSAAESWMSEEALADFPQHLQVAKRLQNRNYLQQLIDEDARAANNWYTFVNGADYGLRSNPNWFHKNLSTNDWGNINVPSYWADEGVGNFNGVVWFRKEIILPQSLSSQSGMLELGAIVDADTAWINGIKVGETSYKYPRRHYEFPIGILRPGKNNITVRVTNSSGKGGFIPDKPYILHIGDTNIDLSGPWKYKIGLQSEALAPRKFEDWKQPLGFYNAMLAPVLNTTIKGVLWYQGETNASRPDEYRSLFPALIRHWRERFNQGDVPFVFVQLPNYLEPSETPQESDWAETRAAQAAALSEPNTAMAVAIDAGEWNDIHPLDKKTVGERLALVTRKLVYGEENLLTSGPTFERMEIKGSKLRLFFSNEGGGLIAKDAPKAKGPGGFALAGPDGQYHWAETKFKRKYLEVWSNKVSEPKMLRYAWADNPVQANLYNKEGFPAAPFETEVKEMEEEEK